ncbi:hypothetical protein CG003_00230 [Mesoplasma florum]|uniref:Uncharacterized protein n=1 Tax=Mesoplasma florum TaxID=2151 RepID=A0A2R3P6J0_MESFO|nr:hypothetical protein CG003_00230 [Mesoplasma florum]
MINKIKDIEIVNDVSVIQCVLEIICVYCIKLMWINHITKNTHFQIFIFLFFFCPKKKYPQNKIAKQEFIWPDGKSIFHHPALPDPRGLNKSPIFPKKSFICHHSL